MARYVAILLFCMMMPCAGWAQHGSLFVPKSGAALAARTATGSLFQRASVPGFLTPLPEVPDAVPQTQLPPQVAGLLDLIALAEAGPAGYNAVQHGARIRPTQPPTEMSLGEVFDWIKATPGQPHAIGRYQFIPATLRRLVGIKGYGRETGFSPEVQDQLALILLNEAGLEAFQARTLPRRAFMKNLARIWAGLPLPSGRSYYAGYAGNKATMSYARFEAGVRAVF